MTQTPQIQTLILTLKTKGTKNQSLQFLTTISDSEEAELLKEFAKITQEREAERQRMDDERRAAELQTKADGIMRGNPLLNPEREDYNIKKKWYDDVVFKHQSRSEPVKKQRFINDTTRNDFHRKFLNKYVK
jgi:protein CWC15